MAYSALNENQAKKVKAELWNGEKSQAEIGDMFFVAQGTVWRIAKGKIFYEVSWPDGTIGELPETRKQEIAKKRHINRALEGKSPVEPVLPGFSDAIADALRKETQEHPDDDVDTLLERVLEPAPEQPHKPMKKATKKS